MTRFVAFPDIHDRPDKLKQIRHVLADCDAVLLAGDMTNGNVENLHKILDLISQFNEAIYAVCGNMDTEAMNMMLAREGMSLHRRHELIDGIAILGCGGALPYYGKYVFGEEQLAGFLEDSLVGVPENMPKILVCHQPPYNTAMDKTETGEHVGSKAVRAFIEKVQPLISFSGHIHSATGIDSLGKTQLINAGPIWSSNKYAYAEIENGEVISLEIREVQALNLKESD
jgi:Icc-related predicted phosphoesterase